MTLVASSIIAGHPVTGSAGQVRGVNPATGESLEPTFTFVDETAVVQAAEAAWQAFDTYRSTSPEQRAAFLELIAHHIEQDKERIVDRAGLESGLPQGRLAGELGRTTGQLRLFARELRIGAHQEVRINNAQPERSPAPAPDLRQRQIPLGPVAVFGASNFPLAFSTAGGDTASALAAGCPVIVKAHNAHPGTAGLVGQAVTRAVAEAGLPVGVFSQLFGAGSAVGQHLVAHPRIKAVGFTGSRGAGVALMKTAAARPEPIPVYAEMSSINPVVIFPSALGSATQDLAAGFVASLTMGSGQFCTNPGLVFVPANDDGFVAAAGRALAAADGQTMLTAGICDSYRQGVHRLVKTEGVTAVSEGQEIVGRNAPAPTLFLSDTQVFRSTPDLQEEIFGSAALIVQYQDEEDLASALESLQGQLTATVHAGEQDCSGAGTILPVLERKVGRILFNGWPTGVEVNDSMVHGGPFPATSDSRTTSVGSLAIYRFQRPVSYQNIPADLLPEALQDANPWGLPRRVDGVLQD
ncbi:aldehyde dehydrogenase (NADP(+)) [Paeniglutamicibacter kerguelensis]|uniref:NADP-dependent aldehyde dehydrogenase n=1 Tax=Paeniglutamicibacter kerguelensis TaxID=254788 RepID=A0ABS4XIU8_9MICC|nr:aldehyde dehydrogenase (NADP(+)) [Paeniglutamicibacter kerguelensis]MBP2388384.1 NADP-dependent aldehyde dehydrogenase [Paeniglutamicibacter kerguelensis]